MKIGRLVEDTYKKSCRRSLPLKDTFKPKVIHYYFGAVVSRCTHYPLMVV
jgi:hypothetical protein